MLSSPRNIANTSFHWIFHTSIRHVLSIFFASIWAPKSVSYIFTVNVTGFTGPGSLVLKSALCTEVTSMLLFGAGVPLAGALNNLKKAKCKIKHKKSPGYHLTKAFRGANWLLNW